MSSTPRTSARATRSVDTAGTARANRTVRPVRSERPSRQPEPTRATPAPRGLRADAQRNRVALLTAADTLFSARGAGVSMDDVARAARVGIGTLYRHFPTREALLAATCDDKLQALARHAASSEEAGNPGAALQALLVRLVHHASLYRGLAASFGIVLHSGSPGCDATSTMARRLLARAQRAGAIRRGVGFDDVVCVVTAIAIAVQDDPPDEARIARLVALFLDGLRARPSAAQHRVR